MRERRGRFGLLCLAVLCLLAALAAASQAAERPPYEFDATLSLTGSCGTSKADPVPDPGCPEKKPPKPFTKPQGIAIDSFGDEYVANYGAEEGKQGRIDVFSPEGVFITEVKDELGPKAVAVDSKGVLYAFEQSPGHDAEFARYKPTEYKPAEGKISYGSRELIEEKLGPHEGGIAIDSNDHVFVDWSSSIQEYNSAAEGNELKATITNPRLYSSTFVALDKQRRRLYASSCPDGDITKCWVLVFDVDTHELLKEIKGPNPSEEGFLSQKGWISVAVDEKNGDFFVGDLEQTKNIYQFNEDYELISTLELDPNLFEGGEPLQIALSNAEGAFNETYLFVPAGVKNRALAFHPPEAFEPEIVSVSATGISRDEAELQATIKPDGAATTYRFEYVSQQAYEEAGETFGGAKLAGEGTILPTEQEAEVKAAISGLEPETTYRFRAFAENEKGDDEAEATFSTYNDGPVTSDCENQSLRIAYSVLLPDCRAYELVTPADTNGQIPNAMTHAGDGFPSVKVSPDGNVITFLTHGGALPGLGGAGVINGDLYRTERSGAGWSTESASPDGTASTLPDVGGTSPDQGYTFWQATRQGSAVIEGKETRYVLYPDGHLALVGRGSLGTDPRARGKLITENGGHIIFETNPVNASEEPIQLEPNAPPSGTKVVYDRTSDEVTHVVSLLPGNETPKAGDARFLGASADGEGIAFELGGKIYLRVGNVETFEIGTGVEFVGVAEEGARVFYLEGGDLFAFDTSSEEAIAFSEVGNAIPVNVATGGTRAYFVSTTTIPGSGENPNGDVAQSGQQNLYLSEGGATIRFVGTVTKRDVEGEPVPNFAAVDGLGLWTTAVGKRLPAIDPSRTTPDGSVLLFSSRANLDGYDPEGAPEIYRYDSSGDRLHCISCIPTKTPATGGASLQSYLFDPEAPPPFSPSNLLDNLRANGKRAFFQSTEALVSRDNDGVQDVYEWEDQGEGSCTRPGGCVYLISSGHSAKSNYLYAMSASGDDVFFTTGDVLVGRDNDTLSIYDARVNGGFPEEVCPEEGCCEGDCRHGSSSPPPLATPATGVVGPPDEPPVIKHCPKGKHKVIRNGKEVCVKNKKHKKRHRKHGHTSKGASK